MATATVSPPLMQPLLQSGKSLALGLLWGSGMLLLYALWLGNGQTEAAGALRFVPWAFVLLGAAAGLWQGLTVRQSQRTPDSAQNILLRQRRLLGIVLVVAGAALLALAGYLGYALRLKGLGESLGLGLFALAPLVAGFCYLQPFQDPTSSEGLLHNLPRATSVLLPALLVVTVICASCFAWLAFGKRIGTPYFPELSALLLESLLCLAAAFWLLLTPTEERTAFRMRVLLLILGGLSGLNLAVMAMLRAILWRREVFLGGLAAWQGENAWEFWLCAYLEVAGLFLMFSSLLIARTDVRSQPVLRLVLYGYNSVVTGFLLLALLIVINVVFYAMFPLTMEWSKVSGLTALSPASVNMLAGLKKQTTVYVLLPENHFLFKNVKPLLSNFQTQTDKLQVKYVSVDRISQQFKDLAERFPEIIPEIVPTIQNRMGGRGGVMLVYGELPTDQKEKVPHTFIAEKELYKVKGGDPHSGEKLTFTFKGEVEIVRELSFLTSGKKKRKVYFTQGNGELDINNREDDGRRTYDEEMERYGCGELIDRLKKDNYEVQGISFDPPLKGAKDENILRVKDVDSDKRAEVPDDAYALVIAGPARKLSAETVGALDRYMERGGKLVVAMELVLDPAGDKLRNTGTSEFLKKYGVEVGDKYVMRWVDLDEHENSLMALCVGPQDSTNKLAAPFRRTIIPLESVHVVQPDAKAIAYKAEPLLQARMIRNDPIWEDSSPRGLKNTHGYVTSLYKEKLINAKLTPGPINVAVTVVENGVKPRLVVFGDSEFLSNPAIKHTREYYSLFFSSLEWLADEKDTQVSQIGIKPKETGTFSLPATVDEARLVMLPGCLMILGIFGLGSGIWVVRRR